MLSSLHRIFKSLSLGQRAKEISCKVFKSFTSKRNYYIKSCLNKGFLKREKYITLVGVLFTIVPVCIFVFFVTFIALNNISAASRIDSILNRAKKVKDISKNSQIDYTDKLTFIENVKPLKTFKGKRGSIEIFNINNDSPFRDVEIMDIITLLEKSSNLAIYSLKLDRKPDGFHTNISLAKSIYFK